MARLRQQRAQVSPTPIFTDAPTSSVDTERVVQHMQAPRSISALSDKENYSTSETASLHSLGAGKVAMSTSQRPAMDERGAKRRRLEDRNPHNNQPNDTSSAEEEDDDDREAEVSEEDQLNATQRRAEQSEASRRRIRENFRLQAREFNERRDDIIAASDANAIKGMVQNATAQLEQVKFTEDATLDSAHLVNLADSTLRMTKRSGNTAAGVDVDEFVSKCISFMRRGGPPTGDEDDPQTANAGSTTQPRDQNRRRSNHQQLDEDDDEAGEALDWETFGRLACFPSNKRPCLPTFLLGPLSVQKRSRQATQRTQRTARNAADEPAARPQELRAEDLQQSDNASLTAMVKKVKEYLEEHLERGVEAVEAAFLANKSNTEIDRLMRRIKVRASEDGETPGVPFYEFVINPRSFNQTVENIFYVSFLIRDGFVGILPDKDGLPMIYRPEEKTMEEKQAEKIVKRQEILTFDMREWREMIELLGIKEAMIPHREQVDHGLGSSKWYA